MSDAQTDASASQPASKGNPLFKIVIVLVLAFFLVKPYLAKMHGQNPNAQVFHVHGLTMGTSWKAIVVASPEQIIELNNQGVADKKDDTVDPKTQLFNGMIDSCEELLARVIQRELDKVDTLASTYRADSEISRFNLSASTGWFDVSPEIAQIVQMAQGVSEQTGGAFDVTVAPLVNLYRFGPDKSATTQFPTDEEIDALRAKTGYTKLHVRTQPKPGLRKEIPELTVDLSGVAKGYAVDLVGQKLEELGLNSYMVEVGGEIRCRGQKLVGNTQARAPWTLGIQAPEIRPENADPFERTPEMQRFVYFQDQEASSALATSGDYNNYRQIGAVRFSHIIDPRTGKPTELFQDNEAHDRSDTLGSVSILSYNCDLYSCAQVDAFATAMFVLGAQEGLELANRLNLPTLFLIRDPNSAHGAREVASNAFVDKINSLDADEAFQQVAAEAAANDK
ncbi:MAG: FAD:protein FMN transferase [Planctomycetia bacterium]|nr:FAD:protein FMN transferase [Planctomycetia bacterium]